MAISAVGGRRASRSSRSGRMPMAEINVTPFVDVMLVLLVIFMVTAPLLTAGVPIELPESRAKALAEERLQATISMNRDGIIFLDERPVSIAELPGVILDMPVTSEGKLPLVTLRADKQLDYGRVMEVMGELNRAGVTSISLVTNASAAQPGEAVSDDAIPPEDVPVEDVPAADEPLSDGSGEVP